MYTYSTIRVQVLRVPGPEKRVHAMLSVVAAAVDRIQHANIYSHHQLSTPT
jgi:hypothetical protein